MFVVTATGLQQACIGDSDAAYDRLAIGGDHRELIIFYYLVISSKVNMSTHFIDIVWN